jgi:mannose-6-phosphate isomerase-like protein (cupin superfamily)
MGKTDATVIGPDEGERFQVGPLAIRTLVPGPVTGGAFEMHEIALGVATVDYHVHDCMDETIHVAEGEIEFVVAGESFLKQAGSVVFIPRGIHHGFSNRGPAQAKVVIVFSPSGDQHLYFRALEDALAAGYASAIPELQAKFDQVLIPPGT